MLFFKKKSNYAVYIDDMSCAHCAARVEKAFSELGLSAKVDLANKCANVKSSEPLNEENVFAAISALGFTPVKIEEK